MDVSLSGITFIKNFEVLRLQAYKPTPDDVWTIGWGHTLGVYQGMIITAFEADQFLSEDLSTVRTGLNYSILGTLEQNQYDALTSLVFNVGIPAWRGSDARKCLNTQDYQGFADQAFSEQRGWVHQAGAVLAGLIKRRAAERDLFFNGNYNIEESIS